LPFRAITAIWGHLGVEWNLLELSPEEREALAAAIAVHRRFRPLLHGGQVVRFDPVLNGTHASAHAHGVYADDLSEALVPFPARGADVPPGPGRSAPIWMHGPIEVTGAQLALHGLQPPPMHPESAMLLHLTATPT
jgi:alpha-galactosidase